MTKKNLLSFDLISPVKTDVSIFVGGFCDSGLIRQLDVVMVTGRYVDR